MPQDDKTTTDTAPNDSAIDDSIKNGGDLQQNKIESRHVAQDAEAPGSDLPDERPVEHGGQAGLEPTRYGDWEKKGRCTDF